MARTKRGVMNERHSSKRQKMSGGSFTPGVTRTGGVWDRSRKAAMKAHTELKWNDAAPLTSAAFGSTATRVTLLGASPAHTLASGTGSSDRIGKKITIKSIQLKGSIGLGNTNSLSVVFHIWLCLDTQANGTLATLSDVIDSTSLDIARPVIANSERFRVLKKLVFECPALYSTITTGPTSGSLMLRQHFDYFKKCNYEIDYSLTTGAITEIRSNNLFLIAGTVGDNSQPTLNMVSRIRYTDA